MTRWFTFGGPSSSVAPKPPTVAGTVTQDCIPCNYFLLYEQIQSASAARPNCIFSWNQTCNRDLTKHYSLPISGPQRRVHDGIRSTSPALTSDDAVWRRAPGSGSP